MCEADDATDGFPPKASMAATRLIDHWIAAGHTDFAALLKD